MPVIRSTPTGISAVVDATGDVVAEAGPGRAARIHATLPAAASATLFARFGNILSMLLAFGLVMSGVALACIRR
jgi:apolipoprotein N-acyltransferase